MTKKNFNRSASGKAGDVKSGKDAGAKMGNYHIELAHAAGADIMTQMLATGHFKEKLTHWVEAQTGIRPDVQVTSDGNGKEALSVYASADFMKKIEAEFKNDIAKIERIKSWSELPPEQQEPWRRGPKP